MPSELKLAFTGNVMIGRAVDRILPDHNDGKLYENCIKHSDRYIDLSEKVNGDLPRREIQERGHMYVWGDLLDDLRNRSKCLIINLETPMTSHDVHNAEMGINYRSHPRNVSALQIAGVKIATLANDHALDWNKEGLQETLLTLEQSGIAYTGAGLNVDHALHPAIVSVTISNEVVHILVSAYGFKSAGVPQNWAAGGSDCGINFIEEPSILEAKRISNHIENSSHKLGKRNHKIKILSLHWGPKWGWGTPTQCQTFAHMLIDSGVDVVLGHSSHHIKGIEVYKGKLIAYGLGDFINDFEGIVKQGFEEYRNDLCCLYFPSFDVKQRTLLRLEIIPCKIKHFKVQRTTNKNDIEWIRNVICKEGERLGTSCEISEDENGFVILSLKWSC